MAATLHWLINGISEGRFGRVPVDFDVATYLNTYPDLQAAFGGLSDPAKKNVAAFEHYLYHGCYETRVFSPRFNPLHYLNRYPDLRAGYGNDLAAATIHWLVYGIIEGRDGS